MRKILITAITATLLSTSSANAQYWNGAYGYGGWGYGYGAGIAVVAGAAILGGVIGAIAATPRVEYAVPTYPAIPVAPVVARRRGGACPYGTIPQAQQMVDAYGNYLGTRTICY